ncbi:transcriptional repressor TCF25-domain-containing protein [Scleroderma yunnanense]
MALRRSKRQQREKDLLVLTNTESDFQAPADETVAHVQSAFAALYTPDDEPEAPSEGSEGTAAKPSKSRKTKKKKKKAAQTSVVVADSSPPAKPGAKMAKGKKKDDTDDVDKALAELSVRFSDLKCVIAGTSKATPTNTLANLLSVSLAHLDAESELRKFFGSKAVIAAESSESGPSSSHRRRRGMPSILLRSQLTRPARSWSLIKQREGLSLRALTEAEASGKSGKGPAGSGGWWTVEYSRRYKGATRDFIRAVMSGSPEALWRVLQSLPWHADTLLQIGEVHRHHEEFSKAVEHVAQAIFAYERAFLGTFSFTSGTNRLDFDFVENRPFFLAIHQQVIDLQRRGCPRSAFEHARLLFSLQPLADPHGALLHLDFLSAKAGMGHWLLDVWKVYQCCRDNIGEGEEYINPSVLPGWAYTRALILRGKEKMKYDRAEDAEDESTQALREAIVTFPSIVPLLADKCEMSLPPEVRSHKEFRIHTDNIGLSPEESTLHLLCHIYAIRSMSLWKSSSLGSWLVSTASTALPIFSSKRARPMRDRFLRIFTSDLLRDSMYRHIIVLEQTHAQQQHRALTAFIPRDVLNAHQYACDPLPPRTACSLYDSKFFAAAEDSVLPRAPRRLTRAEERQIERLVPDVAMREQILAAFDRPGIAAHFPGGVAQFMQDLPQMDDDAMVDLLMAGFDADEDFAPDQVGDVGGMPGGLPDDGVEDLPVVNLPRATPPGADYESARERDESEDEEDEEDEGLPPMHLRVLQNLFNRLMGTAGGGQEESSDDDAVD